MPRSLFQRVVIDRTQRPPSDTLADRRTSHDRLILLKKSLTVSLARLSSVFLPLTGARERLVGRSERSIFLLADCKSHVATFSTVSGYKLTVKCLLRRAIEWQEMAGSTRSHKPPECCQLQFQHRHSGTFIELVLSASSSRSTTRRGGHSNVDVIQRADFRPQSTGVTASASPGLRSPQLKLFGNARF
jgi:hypothetical protein